MSPNGELALELELHGVSGLAAIELVAGGYARYKPGSIGESSGLSPSRLLGRPCLGLEAGFLMLENEVSLETAFFAAVVERDRSL